VGRPSSSPFDKTNCALDYDFPLGFAVILSSRWGKAGLWVHFRGSSFDGPSWSSGHFGWTTNQSGSAENRHIKAMDELAAVAASKEAAKDKHQAAKTARAAESIAQAARDEVATAQRRCSPAVVARKESLRRRPARARAAAGHVASFVCARGAVVEAEPRPKRQRQAAGVMGMGGPCRRGWVDGGRGSQGGQLGEA